MAKQAFELTEKTPCDGLLPLRIGKLSVSEDTPAPMTLVMPYQGKEAALSTAMKKAHGVPLPEPGQVASAAWVSAVWFGRGQYMLMGVQADAGLSKLAALSDQSDAWTSVIVQGISVEAALARLVPIDLRADVFGDGHTARTLIGHMNGSVTRMGKTTFRLMVFRSMAGTLVHDLAAALESVAARSA